MGGRILCDRHHAGLFHSLQLIFEDSFDVEVFTPVGHEWWDAGYWQFGAVFGDDRLAQQYLIPDAKWDRRLRRPSVVADGFWGTFDPDFPERPITGITLDEFKDHEWRFVLASVQENQHGFHRLAKECGAIPLYEVGNTGQYVDWTLDGQRALVSSSAVWPDEAKAVRYHQRLAEEFSYLDPPSPPAPWIRSFVNLLSRMPQEWQRFTEMERLLNEFTFAEHGHEARNGFMQPQSLVVGLMRNSLFAWHDKPTGDGFGHVIHSWAAVGRPLIGRAAPYVGQLAAPFWDEGVTSFDLDAHSPEEIARLVREVAADPGRWLDMCLAIRARFDSLVDYDAETAQIAALLGI